MVTSSLLAVTAILLFVSPTGANAHAACVGQEATAIALVALHEGPNCSLVSLRGIQQQAAILAAAQTADSALSKDGMNFRVRVFDTCSDPREAVSATLRSLAALPHACLQPPLLLGFVGPEDGSSLEAVQKVTKVFNLNHALPFRPESAGSSVSSKQGPLYVTATSPEERLQSVVQLLTKLQWDRVTLLHTRDSTTTKLAATVARHVCSSRAPLALPEYGASVENYVNIMETLSGEGDSPVVILAGSTLPVTQFLRHSEHRASAYLVVATAAGLLPELMTMAVSVPVLVVQYTAGRDVFKSSLWEQYSHQHLLPANSDIKGVFADVQDPTVTPMANAVLLYGSALGVVRQARCQGRPGACPMLSAISPDQWRNLLAVAMAPADSKDPTSKRIRFRMDIPAKAELFLKKSLTDSIIQVGHIDSGKLEITSDEFSTLSFAVAEDNSTDLACWNGAAAPAPSATKSTTGSAPEPDDVSTGTNDVTLQTQASADDDFAFYEMIAYLSGISAGIFLIFMIGLFIVVRSFVPKKRKCSPPSSVCSVRTRD